MIVCWLGILTEPGEYDNFSLSKQYVGVKEGQFCAVLTVRCDGVAPISLKEVSRCKSKITQR